MHEINGAVVRLETTLTNQFLDIPPANLSILEFLSSKGVIIGLSSRSSIAKLESYLRKKKIDHLFSFLIGSYGAEYKNLRTGEKTDLASFSLEEVRDLEKQVSSLPISAGVWYGKGFTFDKPGLFALVYAISRYKSLHCKGFSNLSGKDPYYKVLLTGSKSLLDRIDSRYKDSPAKLVRYTSNVADLIPLAADPWNALQHALTDFGLQPENILTFNASPADAELMKHTWSVLMKGTDPRLVPLARRIAKYNGAQNGIAYMINTLIMEKACVFKEPQRKDPQ